MGETAAGANWCKDCVLAVAASAAAWAAARDAMADDELSSADTASLFHCTGHRGKRAPRQTWSLKSCLFEATTAEPWL